MAKEAPLFCVWLNYFKILEVTVLGDTWIQNMNLAFNRNHYLFLPRVPNYSVIISTKWRQSPWYSGDRTQLDSLFCINRYKGSREDIIKTEVAFFYQSAKLYFLPDDLGIYCNMVPPHVIFSGACKDSVVWASCWPGDDSTNQFIYYFIQFIRP